MYELLYLFGRDLFAGPCIFPSRLRLCDWVVVGVCILARFGGGAGPVLGPEDVPEERHVGMSTGGCLRMRWAASAAEAVNRRTEGAVCRWVGARDDAGTARELSVAARMCL